MRAESHDIRLGSAKARGHTGDLRVRWVMEETGFYRA